MEKLEVGDVNAAVSQSSLSLALRVIHGSYLSSLVPKRPQLLSRDCTFKKDRDNRASLDE